VKKTSRKKHKKVFLKLKLETGKRYFLSVEGLREEEEEGRVRLTHYTEEVV
jgi:hypothetical protein